MSSVKGYQGMLRLLPIPRTWREGLLGNLGFCNQGSLEGCRKGFDNRVRFKGHSCRNRIYLGLVERSPYIGPLGPKYVLFAYMDP